MSLSVGFVDTLLSGGIVNSNLKPILQVLGYIKIPNTSVERYRLLLWDGQSNHSYVLLATHLNHLLLAGELDQFTVIQLEQYVSREFDGKRMLIVVNFSVLRLGSEVGQKIVIAGEFRPDADSYQSASARITTSEHENSYDGNTSNGQHLPTTPGSNPVPELGQTSFNTIESGGRVNRLNDNTQQLENTVTNNNSHCNSLQHDLATMPATNLAERRLCRIEGLSPYQLHWTIRARVTHKSALKNWSKGQLFSVDLTDETGEIRAVGWNEVAHRLYKSFLVNKVCYISNGVVSNVNLRYGNPNQSYEISLRHDTLVQVSDEDCADIPVMRCVFVPIANLVDAGEDCFVDVIGICTQASDVQTIIGRHNKQEYRKRDIMLSDQTARSIRVTLWGEEAVEFDGSGHPVVALKGAKVTNFGGIGLGTLMSTILKVNLDIPEAHVLKDWYDRNGKKLKMAPISNAIIGPNWKTFIQFQKEKLGYGTTPDYFTCKATIVLIKKENCLYQACPATDCRKKVTDSRNGSYYCEKCNKDSPDFKWCLLLSVLLVDFSGHLWATCFQETAEIILGKTSAEMGELRQTDDDAFQQVFYNANFRSFIFNLRSKMEVFNDECRVKTQVTGVAHVDHKSFCKKLLDEMQA